jgi:hypothetical protein
VQIDLNSECSRRVKDYKKPHRLFSLMTVHLTCSRHLWIWAADILDTMALNKRVDIEVLLDTWKAPTAPPAALTLAAQTSPLNIDFLCALIFTALWTRPPIRYGFSLSDCWAWLRYFPAIAPTQDLRLCDAWTTLDPHHKTVLSGDFGVGFTTWFLNQTLDFVKYSDTLWVVNTLSPGAFRLASSARRGPKKSPDYIAEDSNGNLSVLECKGGQSSRKELLAAMERGIPQKANVQAIGTTQLQHSLVAGLFIPQFDNSDSATIVIGDPEWGEFKERLSPFSREEIGRSVSQVAHAKELAMLELPNTANTLVRAQGSEESITGAIKRDLSWERTPKRHITTQGLRVEREYRWSEAAKVTDNLVVSGIRFEGSLAFGDLESLETMISPAEYGEQKRSDSLGKNWIVEQSETSVAMQSPFGATFKVLLLEE